MKSVELNFHFAKCGEDVNKTFVNKTFFDTPVDMSATMERLDVFTDHL